MSQFEEVLSREDEILLEDGPASEQAPVPRGSSERDEKRGGSGRGSGDRGGRTPKDDDSQLKDQVLKTIAGIGAGIGVVGFVALAGGADFWLRFSSAGLPADESVVELSHSQLIVVGARIVVPFVALAALMSVGLYLIERAFDGTMKLSGLEGWINRRKLSRPQIVRRVRIAMGGGAIATAVLIDGLVPARMTLPALAVLAFTAVVLSMIVVVWACATGASLIRFIIATLCGVAIFAVVSGASITAERPTVRPVALVVNGSPLAGLYIDSSSDTVFVGEVCTRRNGSAVGNSGTGSVLTVPRKSVSVMLIGDNAALADAISRERTLLSSLHVLAKLSWGSIEAVAPTDAARGDGVRCTNPAAAALDWVVRAPHA